MSLAKKQTLNEITLEGLEAILSGDPEELGVHLRFVDRDIVIDGHNPPQWAVAFETWLHDAIMAGNLEKLLSSPQRPDIALKAHPTPEHLMPLFVSIDAGLPECAVERLHQSFSYCSIGMACYAFGSFDEIQER